MGQESLNILIGGDFATTDVLKRTKAESFEKIWGNALEIFKSADLRVVNLEVPVTNSENNIEKTGPSLKADKHIIDILKVAEIDIVTLANNHISDYGNKGVEDTLSSCFHSGIDTVGAGMNIDEAQKVYYKIIKKKKIAIVNFAENEFNCATDKNAGFNPMNLIDNIKQIREAKDKSDFVIVIVHGGVEHYPYPTPRMKKQYRFYAEEGADVVVGHHIHCVSGYEIFNGVPIFYSLGNLFFPYKTSLEKWHEGMILKLEIEGEKVKFELIPYFQCKNGDVIEIMKGDAYDKFFKEVEEINEVIKCDSMLEKKWNELVQTKEREMISIVNIPCDFLRRLVMKLNLDNLFRKRKQKKLILNLVRCESHREVLLGSLRLPEKK